MNDDRRESKAEETQMRTRVLSPTAWLWLFLSRPRKKPHSTARRSFMMLSVMKSSSILLFPCSYLLKSPNFLCVSCLGFSPGRTHETSLRSAVPPVEEESIESR